MVINERCLGVSYVFGMQSVNSIKMNMKKLREIHDYKCVIQVCYMQLGSTSAKYQVEFVVLA